jgi:hypothetical protein
MARGPKIFRAVAVAAALVALAVATASGAVVKVGPLILRANGGFSPTSLPRKAFAPIEFNGRAEVERKGGGVPPALEHAVLEFDRDGRLSTAGLPQCPAERIADATPEKARTLCKGAIVGEGHVEGLVAVPGRGAVPTKSLLTLFNGPRLAGNPTVVLHAQFTSPVLQTFAIVVPIEKVQGGSFGYRATLDVPPVVGGIGALTHIDFKIGRRYSSGGVKRSYVSARCRDGVFETHGAFTFADGTVIEGTVYEFCRGR